MFSSCASNAASSLWTTTRHVRSSGAKCAVGLPSRSAISRKSHVSHKRKQKRDKPWSRQSDAHGQLVLTEKTNDTSFASHQQRSMAPRSTENLMSVCTWSCGHLPSQNTDHSSGGDRSHANCNRSKHRPTCFDNGRHKWGRWVGASPTTEPAIFTTPSPEAGDMTGSTRLSLIPRPRRCCTSRQARKPAVPALRNILSKTVGKCPSSFNTSWRGPH